MSMTFTIADELRPGRRHVAQRRSGDPTKSTLRYMPFIFGGAFIYEPSTGDLSTTEEFGGILIGQLDKYLSQAEVQAAIRDLGEFLEQQSDR
jgi:hypothetical protein